MTTFAQLAAPDATGAQVAFQIIVGASLSGLVHPAVIANWTTVPDGTITNSTLKNGVWTPYVPPTPAAPAPTYPTVSAAVYYDLFTALEMIDIEAAVAAAQDKLVGQFYKRWQVALQGGQPIFLGAPSVGLGLDYLTATAVPAATPARNYLAAGRKAQILLGIHQ